jgi:hypothetical protein
MEGARWNYDKHYVDSSLPKTLYTDFPMVHLLPKEHYVPAIKEA